MAIAPPAIVVLFIIGSLRKTRNSNRESPACDGRYSSFLPGPRQPLSPQSTLLRKAMEAQDQRRKQIGVDRKDERAFSEGTRLELQHRLSRSVNPIGRGAGAFQRFLHSGEAHAMRRAARNEAGPDKVREASAGWEHRRGVTESQSTLTGRMRHAVVRCASGCDWQRPGYVEREDAGWRHIRRRMR